MSQDKERDFEFFNLRQEAKTYISKLFTWGASDQLGKRNVTMVMEGSDELTIGEIEGAMCLRLSGKVRKSQVTAIVTQDEKKLRRLTLQSFKLGQNGDLRGLHEDSFTFRQDEFDRLLSFLSQIKFTDLSNEANFQIEDISSEKGSKTIIDASDKSLFTKLRSMTPARREQLLESLSQTLSAEDVNILLGRKQGLETFENHISSGDWSEKDWQEFFEQEQWVFGYGLDYRIMETFDREMVVGAGGTDNQNRPTTDFLMEFTDYTVLVEIKKPDTPIFKTSRGGRAGTWELSPQFTGAISQILEQKAEWLAFAQSGEHYSKDGRKLESRTRNAKTILVIGSLAEMKTDPDTRTANLKLDTFEMFRRDLRSIDIITFDELLDRARFIAKSPTRTD